MKGKSGLTSNRIPRGDHPLWTVEDVAAYLKASPSWVYKCVADGQLPGLRIRGMLRFLPDQVRAAVLSAAEVGGAS